MRKPGDLAIDAPDDAVEEALSDHHLDELVEMIDRSRADDPSLETSSSDSREESNHRL